MMHLIDWCQQNPLVHRLELQVFNNNPAGIRFYGRPGFQHEGAKKESYFKQGEYLDLIQMAMLFKRDKTLHKSET